MLVQSCIKAEILRLEEVLMSIDDEEYNGEYSLPREKLYNASVGKYAREIIEMLTNLIRGYDIGYVNYHARSNDERVEVNNIYAISILRELWEQIARDDKPLTIDSKFSANNQKQMYDSSYGRELMYILESMVQIIEMILYSINEHNNSLASINQMKIKLN